MGKLEKTRNCHRDSAPSRQPAPSDSKFRPIGSCVNWRCSAFPTWAQCQRAVGECNDRAGYRPAVVAAVGIKPAEFDQVSDCVSADQEVDHGGALPLSMAGAANALGAGAQFDTPAAPMRKQPPRRSLYRGCPPAAAGAHRIGGRTEPPLQLKHPESRSLASCGARRGPRIIGAMVAAARRHRSIIASKVTNGSGPAYWGGFRDGYNGIVASRNPAESRSCDVIGRKGHPPYALRARRRRRSG